MTTRSAVIAALNGQADAPKFDIRSRAFVEQWIKHPDQLAVLKKAYADNAIALTAMRKATKEGKITEEIRRRTDQEFVRGLLVAATPGGVSVGPDVVRQYLERVNLAGIPSLAIETAIADPDSALPDNSQALTLESSPGQKIWGGLARQGHLKEGRYRSCFGT